MNVQTQVKAGVLTSNHNQTVVRRIRVDRIILVNHNSTLLSLLRANLNKDSRIVTNHNQTLVRLAVRKAK